MSKNTKKHLSTNLSTNNKGFSLIELMVVVAIIGILSAIGIPQYAKFQAKSRQTEAKSHLNALFVAEASYKAEWNQYSIDLKNIGLAVTGSRLRYTAGFNAAGCTSYTTAGGAIAETTANSQLHVTAVNTESAVWDSTFAPGTTALTIHANAACSASAFVGIAVGDPRNSPTAYNIGTSDTWSVNESKLVSNLISGL